MAKRKNRKKEYILGLKRQGLVKTTVDVVKVLTEKTEEVKKEVKAKANDFESFAKEFEGVAASRLEAFYEQGIKSAKDFANWTEKELLTLKGIGPATIKQLKEFGIKFKK
ncbi:helix-hairpin-helix domain-containing protein [Streptococcus henryi]|uniref:helix-hairpin-helix domain-containing protein n=1 Tax=Streptococcus henryi TaxID=439219 RepID=UPI000365B541|nr:helix-hairpin-helix domain-containing protein [Streptococcus henryi]